jgi:hypothetical protein
MDKGAGELDVFSFAGSLACLVSARIAPTMVAPFLQEQIQQTPIGTRQAMP